MGIGPLNRVTFTLPVDTPAPLKDDESMVRQIVTAIRGLNKSELLMGQNRSLSFTRDPDTHRPVIQIVNRETGDVIDQIPPEALLRLKADLDREKTETGKE